MKIQMLGMKIIKFPIPMCYNEEKTFVYSAEMRISDGDMRFLASLTRRVISPFDLEACTTTTSCPWKRRMVGWVKGSNDVASPLHAALNIPAPVTSKVN